MLRGKSERTELFAWKIVKKNCTNVCVTMSAARIYFLA